ncbi:MAG: hypothetical protein JHD16_13985 [Solirubrobacteraceae bacterium]|nr:hypothetical protein [Solirubrobacteraceae bacterium]
MSILPLSRSRVAARTALIRTTRSSLLAVGLAGLFAGQAAAAGAPIVSVTTAPQWSAPGAYKLSATVNPNGATTVANIEYGPTTSYGTLFTGEHISSTSAPRNFVRTTAAQPIGSTVNYRVRAVNTHGVTYGPNQTYVVGGLPFVSPASRPQAVLSAARDFRLGAKVNPNGLATTTVLEYGFGSTVNYSSSMPASNVPAGALKDAVATLVAPGADTTVHFRIAATNAAGTIRGAGRTYKVPRAVVRPVYMVPNDRAYSSTYRDLIMTTARNVQEWYAGQTGGKTFTLATEPIVCMMNQPSTWYGTETTTNGQLKGAWSKLNDSMANCPLVIKDDYTDNLVYADVPTTCNDRIGSGAAKMTIMGEMDLRGLNGATAQPYPWCDQTKPQFIDNGPVGRWQGGTAHELGHSFSLTSYGLYHPNDDPGGQCAPPNTMTQYCYDSLMYLGYTTYPNTHLLTNDKARLSNNPWFS